MVCVSEILISICIVEIKLCIYSMWGFLNCERVYGVLVCVNRVLKFIDNYRG